MTVKGMQDKILQLKKEKDICILAQSYVAREIIDNGDVIKTTDTSINLEILSLKN